MVEGGTRAEVASVLSEESYSRRSASSGHEKTSSAGAQLAEMTLREHSPDARRTTIVPSRACPRSSPRSARTRCARAGASAARRAVDFDRWLLVAPDVGALGHCARTLRFSRASKSGQSRRRARKSKDLCSAAVRSKAAVIAQRRVPAVWLGLLRPTTQTRGAGRESVRRGSRSRWEPWPAPLPS